MNPARRHKGQILIPGLLVVLTMVMGFLMFVNWGKRRIIQMRMNLAADATALSAARAKAESLNTISSENTVVNAFVRKARVPMTSVQVGEMSMELLGPFQIWKATLRSSVVYFNAVPARIGMAVARFNGATNTKYSPFDTGSKLVPMTVHILLHSKTPPYISECEAEGAYYARGWSDGFRRAQPPHRATWIVSREGIAGASSARVWLDANPSDVLNNGGFPRVKESMLGDAFIQGFYPQFNARLSAIPSQLQAWVLTEGSGL